MIDSERNNLIFLIGVWFAFSMELLSDAILQKYTLDVKHSGYSDGFPVKHTPHLRIALNSKARSPI